jgi:hypothetical protein
MNDEYEKIKKLRFRDRITSSDINFIQQMHPKYCGHLQKNICWQCPASIREALFDLLRFIEWYEKKIQLENESQVNTIKQSDLVGERDQPVSTKRKVRKSTDDNE